MSISRLKSVRMKFFCECLYYKCFAINLESCVYFIEMVETKPLKRYNFTVIVKTDM